MKVLKVALYARVSTDLDERDIKAANGDAVKRQDPEVQLIKHREFTSNYGWQIVGEFVGRASGSDASRPQFDRMMEAAYRHEFDLILVVRIDRIIRSLVNLLNVLQDLQASEVGLKATDHQIDLDTPTGRLMVNLLGAFAEWEKEIIRERVKDGMDKARLKGTKSGKPIGREPSFSKEQMALAERIRNTEEGISWSELSRRTQIDRRTLRRYFDEGGQKVGVASSNTYPAKKGGGRTTSFAQRKKGRST